MTTRTIKGVFLNPEARTVKVLTVEDNLDKLYELLDCRLIEAPERRIGIRNHHYYTIICDEQGTFVEDPYISAIDNMGRTMLVGSLFICNTNEDGEFCDLTDKQIANVLKHINMMQTRMHRFDYPMLCECEY